MRLGRIILLASLAQLLGLTTLAAALSEHPAFTNDLHRADEAAAWQALAPVVGTDVPLNLAHVRASYHAVFAVTALSDTSFKHSVWMVSPAIRTVAIPRPRRHALLRC
jgi:hypothetical protein